MKEMKRMAPAILIESRDGDSSAFLHLDLSGEPLFFELDTVYDQFRDAERQVNTSRKYHSVNIKTARERGREMHLTV
jgi:hypothetical protein